jgi:hypothetical protein
LLGVFLSKEIWERVESQLAPLLEQTLATLQAEGETEKEKPFQEPIQDWEMLKKHWDFKYPIDTDIHCELCGNATVDWQADEPRKFLLKAANLGGLVRFQCCRCQAYITKRHFKDSISVEAKPRQDV